MPTPPRDRRVAVTRRGRITRGTTGVNRLRRLDRWLVHRCAAGLRRAADPLVVDLGFGARITTTLELAHRLRLAAPHTDVVGVDIDPERVACAVSYLADTGLRVTAHVGGFTMDGPIARRQPLLVRAANVLRQYEENEVPGHWATMTSRLAPGGLIVDATCDEVGRIASWIALTEQGPESLTVSLRLAGLTSPSVVAERLPKALIHRNVPGERVHDFLTAMEAAWLVNSPLQSFGARHRWIATCERLAMNWPVRDRRPRWRLGELSVDWDAVAPSTAA